jgi:hypothetical protein
LADGRTRPDFVHVFNWEFARTGTFAFQTSDLFDQPMQDWPSEGGDCSQDDPIQIIGFSDGQGYNWRCNPIGQHNCTSEISQPEAPPNAACYPSTLCEPEPESEPKPEVMLPVECNPHAATPPNVSIFINHDERSM